MAWLTAMGLLVTAWLVWRRQSRNLPHRMPAATEAGMFAFGVALAWSGRRLALARRRRKANATGLAAPLADCDQARNTMPHGTHNTLQDATPLPQGAQSLLAILARALGDAEAALYVRQGSRLICRSQEPRAFGAQALATKLMAALVTARPSPRSAVVVLHSKGGNRKARSRHVAVALYPENQTHNETRGAQGVWAVLFAQRRQGTMAEADLSLVCGVAEQIAASLHLEQALRLAQADRLRLEHMATTDGLTELANRRHFMRIFALQLARAKRYNRRLSLIFLDIDHFKQVNDTFGHAVGDAVLKGVARALRQTARKTDTVARYGGEEFAILMEETGLSGAQRIAERIQEALKKERFGPDDASFQKTVSVGVATFPEHGDDPERIIACADEALYEAKRNGRDQITLYRGPMTACPSEPR